MPTTRIHLQFLDVYAKPIDSSTANQLPSKKDVLSAICWEKIRKNIEYHEAAILVATEVMNVWNMASIPTNTVERVIKVTKDYLATFRQLVRTPTSRITSENFLAKKKSFLVSG